jgi:hypothetical protein
MAINNPVITMAPSIDSATIGKKTINTHPTRIDKTNVKTKTNPVTREAKNLSVAFILP